MSAEDDRVGLFVAIDLLHAQTASASNYPLFVHERSELEDRASFCLRICVQIRRKVAHLFLFHETLFSEETFSL